MQIGRLLAVLLVPVCVFSVACREQAPPPAVGASPAPSQAPATERLTARDVQAYLAVRSRALLRLEEALAAGFVPAGDVLARLEDIGVAERAAAQALGVEWGRYTRIRQEVGRLLGAQRRHDDARVLAAELARTRDDLAAQLARVRDQASREFLAAQIETLERKLGELEQERTLPAAEVEQLALIEEARAELATLQGRQEQIQRRAREILEKARAAAVPTATPSP